MITKQGKRILVTDDSELFRTEARNILEEGGHEVDEAADGSEAIGRLKRDAPDMVVLDLQMPVLDGFGVLEWMNVNGRAGEPPVLVVTGAFEASEVIGRLRELGARGVMNKGFSPQELIFRTNAILFRDKSTDVSGPRNRVPASVPVDFTIADHSHAGTIMNLSETGAFINTDAELLTGAFMTARFTLPGGAAPLEMKATVRWTTEGLNGSTAFCGGGVMFTDTADEATEEIRAFVENETKRLGL